jgi:hypothetical protein
MFCRCRVCLLWFASMGKQAELCWKEAAECWRLGQAATDAGVRLMYFELANRWRDAAESAEALDRKRQGSPWEATTK